MRRILGLSAFILISSLLNAQSSDSTSLNLKSPYHALQTFATNMDEEDEHPEKAIVIFNFPGKTHEEKVVYANRLQEILEGGNIYLVFKEIPTSPTYYDSIEQDHKYILSKRYPEIFLLKRRGRWQFQPGVIQQMEIIHNELYLFNTDFLLSDKIKNGKLSEKMFGLKLWQWLGIFFIIGLGVIVHFILSFFIQKMLIQMLDKVGEAELGSKIILPIARPSGILIVLIFIALLFPMLRLPQNAGHFGLILLKIFIPIYGMIILYRLINVMELYMIKLAARTKNTLDDQLVPMVKKTLKIGVLLVGSLVILDGLDIPILPLLTGLSIGGLAFALAAQDTIKNFFGSLMIFIDKPFQIGDWITSSDIDGTVEEVGFRSTRIRTFRNSVISVPNGSLADQTIDNNGLRQFRRFRTIIKITYDTPADLVETYVEGLKRLLHAHPMTNKENYEIHFNDLGDSSLDILFYIFFEAPTWSDELKCRQEMLLQIMKLTEHLGIQFAFPTQTMHVESFPGKDTTRLDANKEGKSLDHFFESEG